MTLPIADTGVYNDFSGLAALKKSARANDPEALRQVAKQYESLFARMMLKSMRDAVGTDPIFGSDQEKTYQEMYDDQLSLELTKGKGFGLADMLVRQLQSAGAGGSASPAGAGSTATGSDAAAGTNVVSGARTLKPYRSTYPAGSSPTNPSGGVANGGSAGTGASPETQENFISELWPSAQQAGQQLGVDPRSLIAQAALETHWGTRMPKDATGSSSNNLFGIKAGDQWTGASVSSSTQEYENGSAVGTTGQFRAYDSRSQSFQDYVAVLRNNPRYAAALNTGENVHAFASALQRGGYATDPHYASKITAIAAGVSQRTSTAAGATQGAEAALATGSPAQPLKFVSALPIDSNTGTL